jgi:hypothetical protein
MCDQKSFFSTFKSVDPGSWSVSGILFITIYIHHNKLILNLPTKYFSGIGEAKLDVLGFGDISVQVAVNKIVKSKTLTDVLYVPGLGVNLFSIGAATASSLIARFEDDEVYTSLCRDNEQKK